MGCAEAPEADPRFKECAAVIVDTVTGLRWSRCTFGQVYDQTFEACLGEAIPVPLCTRAMPRCVPSPETSPAAAACAESEVAGHTDWRLPTKDELKDVVYCSDGTRTPLGDYRGCTHDFVQPTIDRGAFPETEPEHYWTATAVETESRAAWYVSFEDGDTGNIHKTSPKFIRCVRP